MAKKTIVLVMNCQGRDLIRYLRSSPSLSCQYDFVYVSNIVLNDDAEAKRVTLGALAQAHVVIAQNVSSVPWLQNDFIAQNIPKTCRFIPLCFWRFYGYWPVPAAKFHPQMWYVGDEVPNAEDLRDYLRTEVPPADIARTFAEQVDKFAAIERDSTIKMLPFFLENHRTHRMFTDEWHPTSLFVHHVAARILAELGFPDDIALLPEDGSDNFRHRLVYDTVAAELGLTYDQTLLRYYDAQTDRETFHAYCRYAARSYDPSVAWMAPDGSFREWCYISGIDDAPYEVARFGAVGDPPEPTEGGLIARLAAGLPGLARPSAKPDVRWSIDLRDFREIRSIDLGLGAPGEGEAVELALMTSTDGRAWREATVIRDLAHAGPAGEPLTLDFREPVLARHVRLEARTPCAVAVESARVYVRAVSLAGRAG